jgi:hypothetical protein
MENESNNNYWLVTILAIALIWALFFHKDKYEDQTAEEWFNQYDEEVSLNDNLINTNNDLTDALRQANTNIEDAKGYAWGNYYDMGYALENLETVPEP